LATPDPRIRRVEVQETAILPPDVPKQEEVIADVLRKAADSMPKGIDLSQEIMRQVRADLQSRQEKIEQLRRQEADDEEQAIVLLLLH
jgi:hypothetical protein